MQKIQFKKSWLPGLCLMLCIFQAHAQFVMIKDINAGMGPSDPHDVIQFDDHLLFVAYDADHGNELWKSDGTTAGTALVKDIFPGTKNAIQNGLYTWNTSLKKVGNRVIFNADDGVHGQELWGSDGTAAGTNLLIDVKPGPTSNAPRLLYYDDSILIFGVVLSGVYVSDLYVTDGTVAGTHKFTYDRFASGNADYVFKYGSKIYYSTNGGGTLHTFNFANYSIDLEPETMNATGIIKVFPLNNKLCYIAGYKDIHYARTVYEVLSFGSTVNTYDVIYNFGDTVDYVWKAFNDIRVAGNKLIFNVGLASPSGQNGFTGDVYVSDGTPKGTHKLPFMNNYFFLCTYNGQIYFQGNYDNNTGNELLATDGTFKGTRIVKDITYGYQSSEIEQAIVYQNRIFFMQEGNLWNSDGYDGTFKMSNKIGCQQYTSLDVKFFNFNDKLLLYTGCFTDKTGNNDTELWRYDEKNGIPVPDHSAAAATMLYRDADHSIRLGFKGVNTRGNYMLQFSNLSGQVLGTQAVRGDGDYALAPGMKPGIYIVTLKNGIDADQHLKFFMTEKQ
jgi:ELWxxDGT repeat protein